MAIYQLNPDAFEQRQNINLVKDALMFSNYLRKICLGDDKALAVERFQT